MINSENKGKKQAKGQLINELFYNHIFVDLRTINRLFQFFGK